MHSVQVIWAFAVSLELEDTFLYGTPQVIDIFSRKQEHCMKFVSHFRLKFIFLTSKAKIQQINHCPAEPGFTLPFQTV